MDFKLIHKKIHGALTSDEEQRFQRWYESSAENRAYFERVRRQREEDIFIKPDVSRAWKKIEKEISPKTKIPYQWIAVAAAIVIGALLFPRLFLDQGIPSEDPVVESQPEVIRNDAIVLIDDQDRSQVLGTQDSLVGSYFLASKESLQINPKNTQMAGQATGMNSLIVPRKMQYELQLSDGTKVWLNSDTRINFPTSFDHSNNRTVYLEYGEAYFEVTPSAGAGGRNFVVETQGQSIEVLGTQFNLSAYPQEEYVATTLVEGVVEVNANGSTTELRPGRQSLLKRGEETFYVHDVDPSTIISWREGVYVFEEKNLAEIMRVLERWYDVEVSFEGEVAKEELLTGVLRNDQELEVIVQILESTHKATFELNNNSIKVRDK